MDRSEVEALLRGASQGAGVRKFIDDSGDGSRPDELLDALHHTRGISGTDIGTALRTWIDNDLDLTPRVKERTLVALGLDARFTQSKLSGRLQAFSDWLTLNRPDEANSVRQIDRDRLVGIRHLAANIDPQAPAVAERCTATVDATVVVRTGLTPWREVNLRHVHALTPVSQIRLGAFAFNRAQPRLLHYGGGQLNVLNEPNRKVMTLDFDPVLAPGEATLYSLIWERPETPEDYGYTVMAPTDEVGYDRLTVHLDFEERPQLVWPIDGVIHSAAPGKPANTGRVTWEPGRASVSFCHFAPGRAYGIAWEWSHGQQARAASVVGHPIRASS